MGVCRPRLNVVRRKSHVHVVFGAELLGVSQEQAVIRCGKGCL